MPFFTALLKTLRKVGPALIAWFIVTQAFEQWILDATQTAMMSDKGQSGVWIFALLSIATSVINPLVATVLVLSSWSTAGTKMSAAFQFLKQHLSFMIREQLRVFGKVMTWSLLLILPGIWKFMELSLVPWVVCLDPEYQAGRRDALKESQRLFYRVWLPLTAIGIFFWLIVPLMMTNFDLYRSYARHPAQALTLTLFDLFVFILCQWLILKLWQREYPTALPVNEQ